MGEVQIQVRLKSMCLLDKQENAQRQFEKHKPTKKCAMYENENHRYTTLNRDWKWIT